MPVHLDRLRELHKRGEQHLKREEWDEAIEVYSEIADLDTRYRDGIDELNLAQFRKLLQGGESLFDAGEWERAIQAFQDIHDQWSRDSKLTQDPHYLKMEACYHKPRST